MLMSPRVPVEMVVEVAVEEAIGVVAAKNEIAAVKNVVVVEAKVVKGAFQRAQPVTQAKEGAKEKAISFKRNPFKRLNAPFLVNTILKIRSGVFFLRCLYFKS